MLSAILAQNINAAKLLNNVASSVEIMLQMCAI